MTHFLGLAKVIIVQESPLLASRTKLNSLVRNGPVGSAVPIQAGSSMVSLDCRRRLNLSALHSDGNKFRQTTVLTAAKTALETAPLRVMLVGDQEEDFFLIREILERSRGILVADLDHARSIEEAKAMLTQWPYELVLFEHETGDAEAVRLVSDFLHAGVSVPFILLTEDADEKTVAEIIRAGTWNCVPKSQLDAATLVRTIGSTMALHSLQQDQH
jgi:CheY-like chemotaxis protein